MGGGDEMWQDFDRAELAEFMRTNFAEGRTVDLALPEHLQFTGEQREFIACLLAHVVEDLTYELSNKWARQMIDLLVAGELQIPDGR